MRVLCVGDVHGRFAELAAFLEAARRDLGVDAAIQVGDFGFDPKSIKPVASGELRFAVPVHAIDGNHEDHRWLHRALHNGMTRDWEEKGNLVYQPRSSVAVFGGRKAGFLGGALHVIRPQHHGGWGDGLPNYILRGHRRHATTLFNQERPDLIVTHSCPSRIGIGIRGEAALELAVMQHIVGEGFDPGPRDDCGEAELNHLWIDLEYRPKAWIFGHFHRDREVRIEGTRFVCLGHRLALDRAVVWDTETGDIARSAC